MRLATLLLDLLYPPKCPFCGRLLEADETGMCGRCQRSLPWTWEGELAKPVDGCRVCLAPLWYRDGVPDGVRRYKFHHGRLHAALFGSLMAQCLSDRWEEPVHLVTWVPLSARGLKRRGYDQARLLAGEVAARLSLPLRPTLVKVRETKTQSRIDEPALRRANVEGAYETLPDLSLHGETVVLVDDVVTSGATLAQCALRLREAGAGRIVALTLARARE